MKTEKVTTCAQRQRFLIALANAPENIRRLAPKESTLSPPVRRPQPIPSSDLKKIWAGRSRTFTGLTETAPFITVCESRAEHAPLSISERAAIKARQGVELITSGELRVVDTKGNDVPR